MTKKFLSIAALTLLLVLASCSKKENLLQFVPEDAASVIKVQVGNLLDKTDSKWDAKDGLQLSEEVKGILGDKDILKDMNLPEGLDLSQDIVIFTQTQTNGSAMVAVMGDVAKFEASMKERGGEPAEKNGVKMFSQGRDIIVYDDNVAVRYSQSRGGVEFGEPDDNAIAILKKPAKNIEGNKEAMKYLGKDGDITIYTDVATAMKAVTGGIGGMGFGMVAGFLGDIYKSCGSSITFDGKKILMDASADINKDGSSYKTIKDVLKQSSSLDALKYVPADASGVLTLSIDGKKLAETLTPLVNQYGSMVGADKSALDAVGNIDGMLAVGVRTPDGQTVNFYAAIPCKDAGKLLDFLKKTYLNMAGGSVKETPQGSVIDFGDMQVVLKTDGNYLVISNSALTGGNAASGAIADNAKGSMISLFVNTGEEGSAGVQAIQNALGVPMIGTQALRVDALDKAESVSTIEKPEGKNALISILKLAYPAKK